MIKFPSLFTAGVFLFACAASLKAELLDSENARRIPFPDKRLTINGLPWFDEDQPDLRRLPLHSRETVRPPVWNLAQNPSGGRIRFRTDSTSVAIRAQNPDIKGMHHMTTIGQSGFDIYVDNEYLGSAWPDASGEITKEWKVGKDNSFREITLYLPLYKAVTIHEILLDSQAKLESPASFALDKPVVYYGSSITQGGCASNPGMSYQAQLSRWLNLDFINLGFSGNGMGEPALAALISEIEAACFVLDYWGNPTPEVYEESLPEFLSILREKFPRTPVIVTGPYFIPSENLNPVYEGKLAQKREIAESFVAAQRRAGDRFITYLDGRKMLSREQATGLVDGVHCNSLGFYFCAKGLEKPLKKALKL